MIYVGRLEALAEVESYRFGIWYELLRRGQGHLAHLILVTGLVLEEAIRGVGDWTFFSASQFGTIHAAGREFVNAAREVAASLDAGRDSETLRKYSAKVESLGQKIFALGRLTPDLQGPLKRGLRSDRQRRLGNNARTPYGAFPSHSPEYRKDQEKQDKKNPLPDCPLFDPIDFPNVGEKKEGGLG